MMKGKILSILIDKLIATGAHLLISAVLLVGALYAIYVFWYPTELFYLDGGRHGLWTLILVDMVLGPLLTFIVYRKNKPKLLKDLTIIGVCQIAAFGGGVYTIYSQRPVLLVHFEKNIFTLSAQQFDASGADTKWLLEPDSSLGIPVVHLPAPDGLEERRVFRQEASAQGKSPAHYYGKLYEPFGVINHDYAFPITDYLERHPEYNDAWQQFVESHSSYAELKFIPVRGRFNDLLVSYSPSSGKLGPIVNIQPTSVLLL